MAAATRRDAPLPALRAGAGPELVLLGGFGLAPTAYRPTLTALSRTWSVTIPDLFPLRPCRDGWSAERIGARLRATLDAHGLERATLVSHSFGAALGLELLAREPRRFDAFVAASSAGLTERLGMLASALTGIRVLRAATAGATAAFARNALLQPAALLRAGAWAFFREPDETLRAVAESGVPSHLLWADDDSFLRRRDGERFARRIGAAFHVVRDPRRGGTVDHGWVYRRPALFAEALVRALGRPRHARRRAQPRARRRRNGSC